MCLKHKKLKYSIDGRFRTIFFLHIFKKSSLLQLEQGRLNMSSFRDFFLGTPAGFQQTPTGTPGQQGLIEQLIAGLSGGGTGGGPLGAGLGNLQGILSGDPQAFEAFAAPARTAFEQRTVPGIAERFSGVDAQSSSAFGQQLGSAAAGLEEQLSAQRGGLQSQALSQLQGLLGQAQQPQFQTQEIAAQPGFLQSLLSALGQFGGQFGSAALGGGLGGLIAGKGFRTGAGKQFGFK